MADLLSLSAVEARAALDAGDVSAPELTGAYLAAIEETGVLNNFVAVTADRAMEMAEASQDRIKAGEAGLIEGIPVGVKDLFCTAGVASTACSKILGGFTPTYESTVTANLWREGGVMLGKINCDEFAMGSANETSAFGPAVNPWQASDGADLVPGGSSGGSASAVAARSALLATGTDTGGSIRQPAAFCGVVGMKPTYGRCSRWGIVAFASSLDQAGPFSRTVADNALMMQAMASHDLKDSTSTDAPLPDLMAALDKGVKGMKIGVPFEYVMDGTAWTAKWLHCGKRGRHGFAMPVPSLSKSRFRTRNTRFPPITSSHLPRRRRTSLAMTVFAMVCVSRLTRLTTCMARPAPPVSVTRCSAVS